MTEGSFATRKQNSPYTMSATSYLARAENQAGEERQHLLIMAAGRYLFDGQWREASSILAQTSDLSFTQLNEKNILLAKIDLMQERPQVAIAKLSLVKQADQLPSYYQTLYHETLAIAYESMGRSTYAIAERIKLEHLLSDEYTLTNNRRILWLTLTKLPEAELNAMAVEAREGSNLQGWLNLAVISKQRTNSKHTLFAQVEQWQQRFPKHPANALLPSPLSAVKPFLNNSPRHIALLLPLTGSLEGPGNAVKDGFIAAQNSSSSDREVQVRLYDTASADAASLYQQAIADGADYVVGPLTKSEVSKVAALDHPVPTLFLNDMEAKSGNNTYHFGLSPSNEARQVAVKASKAGLRKTLIIAPAGAWGEEIVKNFSHQWQMAGGQVVEVLSYDNNTNLTTAVRDFLHVSEKQAQKKQIRLTADETAMEAPKRREDFDMIFLLGYPSKARQIMPLLKYYFAGNVPVYATSSVYGGTLNTMRDKDLDGIIFCDMPWVFANQIPNKNWPEQLNSYSRLYAMGMDSFALGSQLNQLLLFPAMGIKDNSGVLYLNRTRQVARILAWGRFSGGIARLTGDTV
jgi:outer membrane PBP1 activator LpoA protein